MGILDLPQPESEIAAPCRECGAPSRWLDAARNCHCDICDPPQHPALVADRELIQDRGEGNRWLPWLQPRNEPTSWDPFERPPNQASGPGWPKNVKSAAGCPERVRERARALESDVKTCKCGGFEQFEPCRQGQWKRIFCSECGKTIRIEDAI